MTAGKRAKQVSLVMIITVFSKCLGFLRDIVLAKCFGASSVTDAYFVSQTIPESLFSLVVQAIAIGFIPVYAQIRHDKGKDASDIFADSVLKLALIACFFLVVIVNLFPRQILMVFASGFDDETAKFAMSFVRISVFAMFFRITVSVYSAYLQSNDHFVAPAFNGIVLDVVVILSIIVAFYTRSVVLVYGLVAASFLQFVMLFPVVRKHKPLMSLSVVKINDDVKQMLLLFFPVALGVGASQLNVIADRTMSSSIYGAISSLNYANKVDNVFENIVILSLATVMFPAFSRSVAAKNMDELKNSILKSINVVTFTMLPCSVLAIFFSKEIITLLFGGGAFDSAAIEGSSAAMRYYSVGLLCLSYNAILVRVFYALKKVKLVSFISFGTLISNVLMNLLLKPLMGIGGLALATSISNIFTTILLVIFLSKEINGKFLEHAVVELFKISISSAALLFVVYLIYPRLGFNYILSVAISSILGTFAFLVLSHICKSSTVKEAYALLKARKGGKQRLN